MHRERFREERRREASGEVCYAEAREEACFLSVASPGGEGVWRLLALHFRGSQRRRSCRRTKRRAFLNPKIFSLAEIFCKRGGGLESGSSLWAEHPGQFGEGGEASQLRD